MKRLTQNAIALRIARRSIKRNRLQSGLIIAIIAIPMVLAGVALTFSASTKPTNSDLVRFQLGAAQARFQVQNSPDENGFQLPQDSYLSYGNAGYTERNLPMVDIVETLPKLSLVKISESTTEFRTATGVGSITVVTGESWNQAFLENGPASLVSGHVPFTAKEALVSPDSLARFGVELGDSISTTSGQELKVVGVLAEASRRVTEDVVYIPEGALPGLQSDLRSTKYFQLLGASPTWGEIQRLNKLGIAVVSRSVLLNPPPESETRASEIGTSLGRVIAALLLAPLVLLPVAVLAGSAFAFGARRQTRTLAVLSSLGAERALLRKVTLASGVWLGLIGGVIGLSVGAAASYIFGVNLADFLQGGHAWYQYPGFHLPIGELAVALLSSVLLGAASSLIPAIRASNVNILATLRGSRTEGAVRVRAGVGAVVLLLIGIGSIVASLAILVASNANQQDFLARQLMQLGGVLLGIAGAIITVIAFLVGTGWFLVFIRKVLSWFGSTANFAGKDLLFNRKRYSPVIASVLTVTFVASFVASFFYGPTKYQADNFAYRYLPGQAGLSLGVSPIGFDVGAPTLKAVSAEDFWAGVPKSDLAESQRKLVLDTGAFKSATVVNSTVDVLNSAGTTDVDGTTAPQFDVPMPVVVFNPDAMCYYTGLNPKSQVWQEEHLSNMTQADMKKPAHCVGLDDPSRTIVVGGVNELRAIIKGRDAPAEDVLRDGGVVLFNDGYDYAGRAKVSWLKPSDYSWIGHNLDAATKTVTLPSAVISKIASDSFAFSAMISAETAKEYGIKAYPMAVVVSYEGEVPSAATDELNGRNVYLDYSNGSGLLVPETFAWVIILLAALFSLSSTGIALGLSQIEARTDKRTLSAIGAPRSFRARLVSIQALTLTLIGSILGALTGLMLGAAMLNGMDAAMANFPWVQLAALVFGVPTVSAIGFWLLTPRTFRYEVRQALD